MLAGKRPSRGERGVASVQMALIFPVLIGVIWLGQSAALYVYARAIALNSAAAGVSAAAVRNGTVGDCSAAAHRLWAKLAGALTQVTITCTRNATTATATVTGHSPTLLPGWAPMVSQTASAPVERLT